MSPGGPLAWFGEPSIVQPQGARVNAAALIDPGSAKRLLQPLGRQAGGGGVLVGSRDLAAVSRNDDPHEYGMGSSIALKFVSPTRNLRGRGGTDRHAGFKIQFREECRFDSDRPHHVLMAFVMPCLPLREFSCSEE
jgi:hypothetical protein